MKASLQLVLLVVFAVATGALATLLFQADGADAQAPVMRQARECVTFWNGGHYSHANNQEHLRNPEGRFPSPRGWTPVGGGSGGTPNAAVVILCR